MKLTCILVFLYSLVYLITHTEIPLHEDGEAQIKNFVPSHGLTSPEAARLLEIHGKNELVEIKKPKVKSKYMLNIIVIKVNF